MGIDAIGFAAAELAALEELDPSRIDHADDVAGLVERHGEIHPVTAGRLDDDAHGGVCVLGQPVHEMRVPVGGVIDGFPPFPPIGAD